MATKTLSEAAQCASAIRYYIRRFGVKPISVRSDRYSGGSSVQVVIPTTPPNMVKRIITDLKNRFQYGHFDSMNDCYYADNRRKDTPQVKHVFLEVKYSDKDYEEAGVFAENSGVYNFNSYGYDEETSLTRRDVAWQILSGNNFLSEKFWENYDPKANNQ